MTEAVRLAKRLAELEHCSRREAEQYIQGGWVTVDGLVVEEPQFRVTDQLVKLAADASLLSTGEVTILLHKPAGYEAQAAQQTATDMHQAASLLIPARLYAGDGSGIRPLKKHFSSAELVTPLATPASGLVVFTGDWRVARKLRDDAHLLEHEVVVEVTGDIKAGGLERLNRIDHGFTFNGVLLPPARVSWESEKRLRFALKGERPGQVAYLCESVGLSVEAMKRLRIGRVPLSSLQLGHWRYLLPHERF